MNAKVLRITFKETMARKEVIIDYWELVEGGRIYRLLRLSFVQSDAASDYLSSYPLIVSSHNSHSSTNPKTPNDSTTVPSLSTTHIKKDFKLRQLPTSFSYQFDQYEHTTQ